MVRLFFARRSAASPTARADATCALRPGCLRGLLRGIRRLRGTCLCLRMVQLLPGDLVLSVESAVTCRTCCCALGFRLRRVQMRMSLRDRRFGRAYRRGVLLDASLKDLDLIPGGVRSRRGLDQLGIRYRLRNRDVRPAPLIRAVTSAKRPRASAARTS